MKAHSRYGVARKVLIFWCAFIGFGALAGSFGMLSAPDGSALGMQPMLPYFEVLPFSEYLFKDYTFSGIALLCVNGITNLVALCMILAKKRAGITLGGLFGVTLMLWICIQFVILPLNFMSTIYFIFGLAQALTGYAAAIFQKQEQFSVNTESYTNVGTNKKELVVYFSRMGYTRRAAYETANLSGAEIHEIIAAEPTQGTSGFWWCGRYAMHRWAMPVQKTDLDFASYDKITVCSPIWAFSICAPVRGFCTEAAGKVKAFDCVILHHNNGKYDSAAREMDTLLGVKHTGFKSIRCRKGEYKEIV